MSKALIESYLDALWNKKKLDVIPRVMVKNVITHASIGTFYGCKAMHYVALTWLNAFPDLKITFKHSISEKDLFVTHFSASATHQGELFAIPGSGNSINYNGVMIHRTVNSMVAEWWGIIDTYSLRLQMLAKPESSVQEFVQNAESFSKNNLILDLEARP